MREVVLVVCTWLHMMVLVIWIGHMFNALLLFGPLGRKYVPKSDYGNFIAEYRRRDTPVALGSIIIFIITGTFLMLFNESYQGIGDIFANNWSILLFVKHILVLGMIALGVYQGKQVMPKLAQAGKQIAKQNTGNGQIATTFTGLEKKRQLITRLLCGLATVVLLLTASGEVL